LADGTGLTQATVNKALSNLEELGIVSRLTKKQRGRVFQYAAYVAILNEGMRPVART
jgi:predicted transcriptional regulator